MNWKEIRSRMFNFFYSKKSIVILISIFFIIISFNLANSQSIDNLPCYSLAKENDQPVILYEFNPNTYSWRKVGSTEKLNIYSIAVDAVNSTIYAVDGGMLGKLNPITAEFTPIGEIGIGFGDFDSIPLNNIKGLAYQPSDSILFATHNIFGFGDKSNDLLLQIDPSTGHLIRNAMLDSLGENSVDYARIEKTNSRTIGALPIRDVNDIAFHPFSGELYAFHKQGNPAVLSELNKEDGNIEQVVSDVSELDVGGLGFDVKGDLYGTSMANFLDNRLSTYRKFDVFVGSSDSFGPVDQEVGDRVSFICFDCLKQIVELTPCTEEEININNFVSGGPNFSSLKTININATVENPTFLSAEEVINFCPNFEVLVDTQFAIDSLYIIDTLEQILFSAEILNCE